VGFFGCVKEFSYCTLFPPPFPGPTVVDFPYPTRRAGPRTRNSTRINEPKVSGYYPFFLATDTIFSLRLPLQGSQVEYLRVLQTQRTAVEANLEYILLLGEAWRAASAIAGLVLDEH
jgi:hypothetical protein